MGREGSVHTYCGSVEVTDTDTDTDRAQGGVACRIAVAVSAVEALDFYIADIIHTPHLHVRLISERKVEITNAGDEPPRVVVMSGIFDNVHIGAFITSWLVPHP